MLIFTITYIHYKKYYKQLVELPGIEHCPIEQLASQSSQIYVVRFFTK